ncbi:MAG: nucleotide-binding universal stress UspA family protein [Parvicellaceae bacterium]|jgi:nucleotide-binding universal stress UspA family protein
MNTILFPTDFSKNAENAFRYAKLFAKEQQAEIIVIHVYDVPLMGRTNKFTTPESSMKISEERIKKHSLIQCQKLLERNGIPPTSSNCVLKKGSVVNEIVKYAEKNKIDFVIMGTRGESNHEKFWIGSVAAEVTKKVQCPALAIPAEAEYKDIDRILYTTDLIYSEKDVLNNLSSLARKLSAELSILHIKVNGQEENALQHKLDQIKAEIDYSKLSTQIITARELVDGINDYIEIEKFDILAMSTHPKSIFQKLFHQSLTTKMIFRSHIPILVYHVKDDRAAE